MKEFVQMSLEKYDELKSNNEYLKRTLKQEQQSHKEDIEQAERKMCDLISNMKLYKEHILEYRCKYFDTKEETLEDCLSREPWKYGMNYPEDLLKLGFTYEEMDEFIKNKYEEYKKEQQND